MVASITKLPPDPACAAAPNKLPVSCTPRQHAQCSVATKQPTTCLCRTAVQSVAVHTSCLSSGSHAGWALAAVSVGIQVALYTTDEQSAVGLRSCQGGLTFHTG
jgi:hypothetical protein